MAARAGEGLRAAHGVSHDEESLHTLWRADRSSMGAWSLRNHS
jgi:hypothetical protein